MQIIDPKDTSTGTIAHLKWVRQLKVGDYVCDCSFKHLKIVSIHDQKSELIPNILKKICWSLLMPIVVGDWLWDFWMLIARKLNIMILNDRCLHLEDGSHHSANNCCDPVSHAWNHILSKKSVPSEPEQENYTHDNKNQIQH